jgi:hypothetical protein
MNQYRIETQAERLMRFLAHVEPQEDGCWYWRAFVEPITGYGQFGMDGRTELAHRAAWCVIVGPIPAKMWVLHHCDIRHCVNPDHLYLGTQQDNARDMVVRGRAACGDRNGTRLHPECLARGDRNGTRLHPERVARGESAGAAKLTAEDVRDIRMLAKHGLPQRQIAFALGVSQRTIGRIVRLEAWAHV